ncbi:sulfotransferase family protein [Neopusillimonas maritima]|uniref:Sulfotransferase domain-containing protein n=1 Tax=Neopusillimonas maritima TaxID=2026239 RepID=A0A3A1YWP4_9BURK|nr:sulfotransferase [Neopusillimonas maritima]RIY41598.1 hypothetical protein CJP73_06400 [Neopusillimonas maritima]
MMKKKFSLPVLVGGPPSSGTTLFSVLLDSIPGVFCGPELGIFSHACLYSSNFHRSAENYLAKLSRCEWQKNNAIENLKEGYCPYSLIDEGNLSYYNQNSEKIKNILKHSSSIECLFEHVFSAEIVKDSCLVAEKTPSNLYAFKSYLDYNDQAKVIVLIRDPRATISSLIRRGFSLRRATAIWLVEASVCAELLPHPRALCIRYEDLVGDTRAVLSNLKRFLKIKVPLLDRDKISLNSKRVNLDPSIKSLSTWNLNPADEISTKAVEDWKSRLNDVQLGFIRDAKMLRRFSEDFSLPLKSLKDIAHIYGYDLPEVSCSQESMLELLIEQDMICSEDQVYDDQIFHERYLDFDLTNYDPKIVGLLRRINFKHSENNNNRLNELRSLREACCYWYAEHQKLNIKHNDLAASIERMSR